MIKTGNELLKNLHPSQLVIVESWRKVERPLPPRTRILKVWKSWRSEQKYVRYYLKPAHRWNIVLSKNWIGFGCWWRKHYCWHICIIGCHQKISSPTSVTNIKTQLILSQIKMLLKITERTKKSLETTGENASCYTSACSTFQNALIDIQWQLYETHGSFWTFYQKYSISSFWSCMVWYLSNL